MKDAIIAVALCLAALFTCAGGGFFIGRKYEQALVKKYLPTAIDGICSEYEDIGEKAGYKRGIRTCDDMITDINNQGRR